MAKFSFFPKCGCRKFKCVNFMGTESGQYKVTGKINKFYKKCSFCCYPSNNKIDKYTLIWGKIKIIWKKIIAKNKT